MIGLKMLPAPLDVTSVPWKRGKPAGTVVADVEPRDDCERFYGGPLICELIRNDYALLIIESAPEMAKAAANLMDALTVLLRVYADLQTTRYGPDWRPEDDAASAKAMRAINETLFTKETTR